ncbi:hypothetical protein HMN09_01056300 [Mycena chlorophos]|uniref:U6 snRNA phosphodiesterase 1 n=1 Tax=Mycena chlorophos TaxID=658473 RepID=A0A8H6SBH8_MYCCL|nr:hypothetical protein HMN09_01056300 [Mycena chlorophos]
MKRDVAALVSYSSSDSESEQEVAPPPPKKRKLPALGSTLSGPIHIDDPSKHQGRTRTTPHVDGQFATHVYARVALASGSSLGRLVSEILDAAKRDAEGLHAFDELHISMSRPVFLRAHQREEMRNAVKRVAGGYSPFTLSFAQISALANDEGTRLFLVLEIGAGHNELASLTNALSPTLLQFRQKEYYAFPRFHASIGWALPSAEPPGLDGVFPPSVIDALNTAFGARLRSAASRCDVETLEVKIGKDALRFQLGGGGV